MSEATLNTPVVDFAALLKDWRQHRRVSQLGLSSLSGISQRHISFLETGRSRPSRAMVLALGRIGLTAGGVGTGGAAANGDGAAAGACGGSGAVTAGAMVVCAALAPSSAAGSTGPPAD